MTASSTRFTSHSTPIGDVLIVTTDEGIVSLHPLRGALEQELERLTRALRAPLDRSDDDAAAEDAARQLDEYFAQRRREFELTLDWRLVRGFTRAALEAVRRIPYGETAGYGEVAAHAGSPRAARAVGTACATTPFSIIVPVHRVVRSDGSIGEYGGHAEVKAFLLDLERAAGE
ncbi:MULTISPECIES: methylated-DNA--[protein]-cysteine S-methyltransferase [unclassified Microbacterium]|uniref:methylated-DNA--[protein]-cysteine S-methyltransferase n=1 Tax=unclassified Microbacterium TaxID=2609290 RepID=UPI00214B1ACD|nr:MULTISPECIES: methylated-DNA--[protein]-cysteine S-methyltransferase [unclassified Microbacterium]MCR2810581.1 methylated-DNA--[protein]-cysteine S-methyltransferase [Microbacterium sp. zg.B185]WIM18118.1 methylated-DNA--[protein]-cysteine S-methyltransferase [Microbacterium sp. zg-B185]